MERPDPDERARRAAFLSTFTPRMRRKVVDNPAFLGESRPENWKADVGNLTWDDLHVDPPTKKQLNRQGSALKGARR